jgi:two-component system chemotaxis response regulator CheY
MTLGKVLIIDDAETVRSTVIAALEPAGFSVVTASDGIRGIAVLRETRDLDLVIIDLNMPGISGLGVLDWMRKDASPHLPPAVFMTTEIEPNLLEQAKRAGALGWLVKPCSRQQLVSVTTRIINQQRERHGR